MKSYHAAHCEET